MPGVPDQFNEARGFTRHHGCNPNVQVAYVAGLVGHYAQHSEFGGISPNSTAVREAIAVVLREYEIDFPEFRQPKVQVDSEVGGGVYRADPRLPEAVDAILRAHPVQPGLWEVD